MKKKKKVNYQILRLTQGSEMAPKTPGAKQVRDGLPPYPALQDPSVGIVLKTIKKKEMKFEMKKDFLQIRIVMLATPQSAFPSIVALQSPCLFVLSE